MQLADLNDWCLIAVNVVISFTYCVASLLGAKETIFELLSITVPD